VIGAEYLLRMLPKGTHDYAKFITPAELCRFAREAGLSIDALKGMGYNPLTKIYTLNQDTSVNYLIACTKPA
jgi:2-polyprenyl-6-hydroxyphenyl methylase/3-demethylubiquinone-9 3-methyltransferase